MRVSIILELTIDVSTKFASVALSSDGEVRRHHSWISQRNHSIELIPAIQRLLAEGSVKISDLEAVFTTRGPGSFNSLRVGVSTAKAIASGADIPIVGISTLFSEIAPYIGLAEEVVGVIPAGKGRIYTATFPSGDEEQSDYNMVYLEKETIKQSRDMLFCGEAVHDLKSSGYLKEDSLIVNTRPPTRSVSTIAAIAYNYLREGRHSSPEELEPIYVRSAQIDSAEKNRISNKRKGI